MTAKKFQADRQLRCNFCAITMSDVYPLRASAGFSPIVEMNVVLKESSLNLNSRHVLPTPLSPISNSLKR